MSDWNVGDSPTLRADFTNALNAATDPTGITLLVRKPDGSVVTIPKGSMANPVLGRWTYVIAADQAGTWNGEWQATGAVVAVVPFNFVVGPNPITDTSGDYTYDLSTLIGEVRLLANDNDLSQIDPTIAREKRSAVWTDAEIAFFLRANGDNVYLAAADALMQLASNRQLLVQSRHIGGTSVDFGSIRSDLLALAKDYREQAFEQAPAMSFAEIGYTDFSRREIVRNSIIREEPLK